MKRIEWENYQDGDSTPLNAENLNLMQDNIESELDLKADKTYVDNELDLKADKTEILPKFAKFHISTNFNLNTSGNVTGWGIGIQKNLALTTNGTTITLSKGTYRVGGLLFYRHLASAGAKSMDFYLVHNSTNIIRVGITTTAANLYVPIPFPGQIIEASQGDTIKVTYSGAGTSGYISYGNADTYLNIEKIGE